MDFNEYQTEAAKTAIYPSEGKTIYPLLGLIDEAAEVVEKFYSRLDFDYNFMFGDTIRDVVAAGSASGKLKKAIRDTDNGFVKSNLGKVTKQLDEKFYSPEFVEQIKKEVGDIFWYAAALCRDLGISLDDVAQANIAKLKSRQERNCLGGSGDNR